MIAKVILGGRSHVDYDGFLDHGCYHSDALGDVTVILLFFRPPLSPVRGLARVIANVILGGRSHVDYDGFVDHNGAWGNVTLIVDALKNKHCIDQPLTQKSYNIIVSFPRMI